MIFRSPLASLTPPTLPTLLFLSPYYYPIPPIPILVFPGLPHHLSPTLQYRLRFLSCKPMTFSLMILAGQTMTYDLRYEK